MRIDVLTLFPGMFEGPLTESILRRAQDEKLLNVQLHDLRDWGLSKYKQVDDSPYGGGAGMVMRCDVVVPAIEEVSAMKESGIGNRTEGTAPYRILMTPRGKRLTQTMVERLAKKKRLLLVCGRYEGVDQRVVDGGWIDIELSIGDYVLTGGELPAMVLIDAVARHIPGVLGKDESAAEESFSKRIDRKREYPHYTRPETFRGLAVPDVLASGHHKKIAEWRKGQTH
jgi:tRNA (guanine37-N1)-methyltransferase